MAPAGQAFSPSSSSSSPPTTSCGLGAELRGVSSFQGSHGRGEGEKKAGRGGLVWATDKTLTEITLLRPSWSCWEGYRHTKAPSPVKELMSQVPRHVVTQLRGPTHPGSLPSPAPHRRFSLPASSDLPGISGPLPCRRESTTSSRPSTRMERELEETGPRAPASPF